MHTKSGVEGSKVRNNKDWNKRQRQMRGWKDNTVENCSVGAKGEERMLQSVTFVLPTLIYNLNG